MIEWERYKSENEIVREPLSSNQAERVRKRICLPAATAVSHAANITIVTIVLFLIGRIIVLLVAVEAVDVAHSVIVVM